MERLVEFLRTELELGRTFAQSVGLARNANHAEHAKANAVKAAETAVSWVKLPMRIINAEVGIQLKDLDRLIAAL